MLIANFFQTFYYELIDFFVDAKNTIVNVFSDIHKFLNGFLPDEVLIVFLIAIFAFILILIFRGVINKR